MSQLKSSGNVKIDFSNGFTLFTSLTILPQKHNGRKVIYQIGHIFSPLRFSLGLDEKDNLLVWGSDVDGIKFESKAIEKNVFFQKSIFLHFSVIPPKNKGELAKLELGVNDLVYQTEIRANLGTEEDVVYTIGSNFEGKENAAFEMAALSVYNIVLSQHQIKEISIALTKEFEGK